MATNTRTQTRKPAAAARPAAPPPRQPQRPAPQPQNTARAVTHAAKTAVSTDVRDLMRQHAGKGISHAAEDNIVPLVYLLQPLSPQVMRGNERRIEGAEPGDIWLRNEAADRCIIKGETGMLFQPCWFSKCWIEWMPDRGGFVARHPTRPPEATLQDVQNDKGDVKKMWVMPGTNNRVIETREYSGFVIDEDDPLRAKPYTIPFSSTGHTVAKKWMTAMRDELIEGTNDVAPSFANVWRLTVEMVTRNNNSWYQYSVEKAYTVETGDEIMRGAKLYDAFAAGMKQTGDYEENPQSEFDEAAGAGDGGGGADDEVM